MSDALLRPSTYPLTSVNGSQPSETAKTLLKNLKAENANPAAKTDFREAAKKAAEEFESVFVTNMLETMFSGLSTEPPYGGGQGEKVFRSLMLNEYAKNISAAGGFGIADHVYREVIAIQEASVK